MSQTERVIQAFGNANKLAKSLDIAATTVHGWKERGYIPSKRHQDVIDAAKKDGIALDISIFFNSEAHTT